MVVRGWNGDVKRGIFKRLNGFSSKINELALERENYSKDVNLIIYKVKEPGEGGKRRKIKILQIGGNGVYFSYLWGHSGYDIDVDMRDRCIKVTGIDEI